MAIYYWVGGNGTWDNTTNTNWATSSGGAGGNGPPTNADTVNFDANSGAAATVTVTATAVASITTINKSDINLNLTGSPTLGSLGGTCTLTTGTITLNSYTLTTGLFNSNNSNTRAIAFGTGNITVIGSGTIVYQCATLTGMTYSGSKIINFTYSGATGARTIANGGTAGASAANAINVNVSAGTDSFACGGLSAINNLIFTGFSGTWNNQAYTIYGNVTASTGMTVSAGGNTLTFAGTGTQQITTNGKLFDFPTIINCIGGTWQIQDNYTTGTGKLFTLTNGAIDLKNNTLTIGAFSSSNSNTRSILFGTGAINCAINNYPPWSMTVSNFTYTGTPTVNLTYSGGVGTRVVTMAATELQSLNFNISAGTDIVTFTSLNPKNLNFTGFAGTLTNTVVTVYGSLTFSAGMTINAGTNGWTFASTALGNTITTAAKTLDFPIIFNGIGGTWAFQDALTQGSTRAFTITNGTVQLKASATSTTGAFATSGTNQKYLQSTTPGTQATLTQASGTVNATYLSIKDIVATGGATWNALWSNNNVDEGNNSGWVFGDPPIISAVEYTYALRSFTQPRRF